MANEEQRDYEVGRNRPPEWTRFRKGQSGNPKGRPRKKKAETPENSELDDILRQALDRKVAVKQGAETREMSTRELLVNAHIKAAAGGSPIALRDMAQGMRALEERDAERRRSEEERERQLFAHMVAYRKTRAAEWATADQAGSEPEDPWPHPDDILTDHKTMKWNVRGPIDARDVPRFEYYRAERDVSFTNSMIDIRQRRVVACGKPSIWDLLWTCWDAMLPLRWQVLPRRDLYELRFLSLPLRRLRAFKKERTAEADRLRPAAGVDPHDKEGYRFANTVMRPLLKRQGYRSLAEFERAYEETDGNPPWPKM